MGRTSRIRINVASLLATALMGVTGFAPAQTVIVDNVAPDFTTSGTWPISANSTPYGTNSQTNSSGIGLDRATWRPTLPLSGIYEVSAWWVEAGNRANNAPYSIVHRNGTTVVAKNQTLPGSSWQSLGSFEFLSGNGHTVFLRDNAQSGTVVSADAIRLVRTGPLPGGGACGPTPTVLLNAISTASCNLCRVLVLPGAKEPHPVTSYYLHSDLPEIFKTPGVVYSTQPVLPPFNLNDGTPQSLAQRTQVNNGFTSINGSFDVFVFHISSPGDGSSPRRLVVYARNDGTGSVSIDPQQVMQTDGTIGNVHQMESTLGARVLNDSWDDPLGSMTLAPGQGRVVAYSKRFSILSNGSDASQNVNCFGRVRAIVSNVDPIGNPTNLTLFVVGIPASSNLATLDAQTVPYLTVGADSGEAEVNMATPIAGCALNRACGVLQNFVWRSDLVTIDIDEIPTAGHQFQMALPTVQSGGCPTQRQTQDMILRPNYAPPDTVGNYMIEYRMAYRFINRSASNNRAVDLRFGRNDADVGLAWQVATNGGGLPSDALTDVNPARTGWVGPNQTSDLPDNTRSFLESDGGVITLPPCGERYVSVRFLILGNSSLPFQVGVYPAAPGAITTDALSVR